MSVAARLNNALRRLGSGWAVFVEAQRDAAETYPSSAFPDPASDLVDEERRAQFEAHGAHFESRYFLTFVYLPPAEQAARGLVVEIEQIGRECPATRVSLALFAVNGDPHLVHFRPALSWFEDHLTKITLKCKIWLASTCGLA